MKDLNDEQLVELCKQGDPLAFEQLIKQYHIPLFNYVNNLVQDKQVSEDIVQEVFIKMVNNIEKYKHRKDAKFSTWLFTIARNKVMDEFRKMKNRESVYIDDNKNAYSDEHENIEELIMQKSEIDNVHEAINSLPSDSKSMIYMRYYMNFSYNEISKVLSYSPQKVKWRLHDTIEKLRKILKVKEVNADET